MSDDECCKFSMEDVRRYANQASKVAEAAGGVRHSRISPIYDNRKLEGYAIVFEGVHMNKGDALVVLDRAETYLCEEEDYWKSSIVYYTDMKGEKNKDKKSIMIEGQDEGRHTEVWMVPERQQPASYKNMKQTVVGFFDFGRSSWHTQVAPRTLQRRRLPHQRIPSRRNRSIEHTSRISRKR
jgi:hypothetical protein